MRLIDNILSSMRLIYNNKNNTLSLINNWCLIVNLILSLPTQNQFEFHPPPPGHELDLEVGLTAVQSRIFGEFFFIVLLLVCSPFVGPVWRHEAHCLANRNTLGGSHEWLKIQFPSSCHHQWLCSASRPENSLDTIHAFSPLSTPEFSFILLIAGLQIRTLLSERVVCTKDWQKRLELPALSSVNADFLISQLFIQFEKNGAATAIDMEVVSETIELCSG